MRKFFLTAFVLGASLVVASTGLALEKTAVRMADDSRLDGWASGQTCSVIYYNICTGWIWVWSGWSGNDTMGVCFDACCDGSTLTSNWWYWPDGQPAGYGFTGTIAVETVDAACCPTGLIAGQVFLPVSGWNLYTWGGVGVPSQFAIRGILGPGAPSPGSIATDHPALGPTGPQACGTCYPTTRANHSFYWGSTASPLCPGSTLNDGICDAQFLLDAQFTCPVSVDETSWGAVKNLYR